MHDYLSLASRHLSAHSRKTRLSLLSITLSVALVVAIFSMGDVLLQYEKIQVIHDFGNYHLLVKNADDKEKTLISGRIDVNKAGTWVSFKSGNLNNEECDIVALDENFAPNMGMKLLEGSYPKKENELMLENWAAERFGLRIGDTVPLAFKDSAPNSFVVSGIFSDYGSTKASGHPGVVVSMAAAEMTAAEKTNLFLIEFKEEADIRKAEDQIKETLNISEDRMGRNDRLLAVIGQSEHKAAVGIYQAGAILFFIVLLAGVVMIYNTFNISVMERVRQFGLLRCLGASKKQIRRLVRREGLLLLVKGLPLGVLLGMAATFFCCAILKFYNSYLFAEIPLFSVSFTGILAGVAVGFLTVTIASMLPAKKAARVSPLNAVTGSHDIKVSKSQKKGSLTSLFPVEIAMGVGNAVIKKRTLILMSASIAISITMFLGFNVFVDFLHTSLKTTKPYTPDISLVSEEGLSDALYSQLSQLDGAKRVYGRMFGYVEASFDASRLTNSYKNEVGDIQTKENGLFDPPEKSWLISYDKNQLQWAKVDLLEGSLSEERLNQENGIIAVALNVRKNITTRTADLQVGDKVYLDTKTGQKIYTVMGVLRTVPFSDSNLNLATFITTEKQSREIMGRNNFSAIDIQLKKKNQEQTITQIKGLINEDIDYLDSRQQNREMNQTFLTMAVFVYGFVAVISSK